MNLKFNKLRGKIAENNLTHKEVAGIIDVAPNTFSRKINGVNSFTLKEAGRLAEFFNTTVGGLFFYSNVA